MKFPNFVDREPAPKNMQIRDKYQSVEIMKSEMELAEIQKVVKHKHLVQVNAQKEQPRIGPRGE
jgi:hypothetical protein